MELKPPKAKKKSSIAKIISWSKICRTPLLILLLLGTTNCDTNDDLDVSLPSRHTQLNAIDTPKSGVIQSNSTPLLRHKPLKDTKKLKQMKYLRRNMNKDMLNFVMIDYLTDGEVEKRVHYNGITAKETSVGEGTGLKLRQLTDGRHIVQVIYAPTGEIQDCEYITQTKSARNFIKTLRKELKQALDEEISRLKEKKPHNLEEQKYYINYENVSIRLLNGKEELPTDVASWLDYDRLKMQCIEKHEEMKFLVENKKYEENAGQTRFRACLKIADTSVSNMVGKLFFNVVQTKCFILKRVKACTKRSWWGKCIDKRYTKQAFLRDNLPY